MVYQNIFNSQLRVIKSSCYQLYTLVLAATLIVYKLVVLIHCIIGAELLAGNYLMTLKKTVISNYFHFYLLDIFQTKLKAIIRFCLSSC